jgi:hypothetical protein
MLKVLPAITYHTKYALPLVETNWWLFALSAPWEAPFLPMRNRGL